MSGPGGQLPTSGTGQGGQYPGQGGTGSQYPGTGGSGSQVPSKKSYQNYTIHDVYEFTYKEVTFLVYLN